MENKNQPAFPHKDIEYHGNDQYAIIRNGLTKREYFTAMAMQSFISLYPPKLTISGEYSNWSNIEMISELSAKMADSILTQLNKKTP